MSIKRLRSVVQSIGHHAVSGLCYVHPHLGEVCEAATLAHADIDLLTGAVLLDGLEPPGPLKLGAKALANKFAEILRSEGINRGTLRAANIDFQFRGSQWPTSCKVTVETVGGKTVEVAVSDFGRQANFVRGST